MAKRKKKTPLMTVEVGPSSPVLRKGKVKMADVRRRDKRGEIKKIRRKRKK